MKGNTPFKEKQKQNAANVRGFLSSNKLFIVIVLIAAVIIGWNLLQGNKPELPDTETTAEQQEEETPTWRFYPIDLAVLGIGGGFCVIMILREKRKAKEGLD